MAKTEGRKIEVQNFTSPGHVTRVDAEKYEAMKAAYLKVVIAGGPSLTPAQIRSEIEQHLPQDLWPGGEKAIVWREEVIALARPNTPEDGG